MVSHGYSLITIFDEFTRILANRFDQKKEDDYFHDMKALRKLGSMDEFITKLQRLVIITHHFLEEILVFIFIEGLMEPLGGMIKVSSPRSLDDAIRATYDLEPTMKYIRGGLLSKGQPIGIHLQRVLSRPR